MAFDFGTMLVLFIAVPNHWYVSFVTAMRTSLMLPDGASRSALRAGSSIGFFETEDCRSASERSGFGVGSAMLELFSNSLGAKKAPSYIRLKTLPRAARP